MTIEKIYSAIDLRPNAQLRVVRVPYNGSILYHVREYFRSSEAEPYKPGRGIAIKAEHVTQVRRALQLIEEDLKTVEMGQLIQRQLGEIKWPPGVTQGGPDQEESSG